MEARCLALQAGTQSGGSASREEAVEQRDDRGDDARDVSQNTDQDSRLCRPTGGGVITAALCLCVPTLWRPGVEREPRAECAVSTQVLAGRPRALPGAKAPGQHGFVTMGGLARRLVLRALATDPHLSSG